MAPNTSAKFSQRKTQPVVESAGEASPSCAKTGTAASVKNIARKPNARLADLRWRVSRKIIGAHHQAKDSRLPGCCARWRRPVPESGARLPCALPPARLRFSFWLRSEERRVGKE